MKKFSFSLFATVAIACSPLVARAAMMMHGIPAGGDGPAFVGTPSLQITSALVAAGGGPHEYSTAKALTSMVGPKLVQAEVKKLSAQYGSANVASWLKVSDFAVRNAAATAMAAGVSFPTPPASLKGHALAVALVQKGAGSGTFYTGTMLDHLVTHKIHASTMDAIDAKYGVAADGNYHRISNQAFVDVAHALGASSVRLAAFH